MLEVTQRTLYLRAASGRLGEDVGYLANTARSSNAMGCLRTLCEDFLRLVSFGYLAAGVALIWGGLGLANLDNSRQLLRLRKLW